MENQAKAIRHFRGDFEYLSNFYIRAPFKDDCEAEWKTVEHYFQAAKTTNPEWIYDIYKAPTPAIAKALGAKCPLIKDWNQIKDKVMYRAVLMKFRQNLDIAKKLISTHGFYLAEGNTWHDNYWGRCECEKCFKDVGKGLNRLGDILVNVRNALMADKDFVLKIVKEGI